MDSIDERLLDKWKKLKDGPYFFSACCMCFYPIMSGFLFGFFPKNTFPEHPNPEHPNQWTIKIGSDIGRLRKKLWYGDSNGRKPTKEFLKKVGNALEGKLQENEKRLFRELEKTFIEYALAMSSVVVAAIAFFLVAQD